MIVCYLELYEEDEVKILMVFDLVPYKLQLLVQWDPIYLNPLGPGCVHNSGFPGSSSQASYACINAISIMKCKLI